MIKVWTVKIYSSSDKRNLVYEGEFKNIIDVTRAISTYKTKRGYSIDEITIRREMRFV